MKTVNFTEMKNGSKEDYELLEKFEKNFERQTADRIINYLSKQTTTLEGYKITRLEHSLQAATRAFKSKRFHCDVLTLCKISSSTSDCSSPFL